MKYNSFKYVLLVGGITLFASIAHAGFNFQGGSSASVSSDEMATSAPMPPVTAEPIGVNPYIPPATTAEFNEPINVGAPSSSGYAKGGAFQAGTYMKTRLSDPTQGMEVASLPPRTPGMHVSPDRSLIIKNNRTAQNVSMSESKSWRARKNESVREVLERWSSRAGVNFVWDNPLNVSLTQDLSYFGSFDSAVEELIRKSTDSSLESQFQDGMPPVNNYARPAPSYSPSSYGRDYSSPVFSGFGDSRWDVAEGSSLRSILEQWSMQNGTRVIWNVSRDYKFQKPFFIKGTYEQAVERALEQFSGERGKPFGEIYQDPLTGGAVLVVGNG